MSVSDKGGYTVLKTLHGWWGAWWLWLLPFCILWLIVTIPKHLSLVNIITVNMNIKEMANNWMGGDGSVLNGEG
jgi:hypothetical protein